MVCTGMGTQVYASHVPVLTNTRIFSNDVSVVLRLIRSVLVCGRNLRFFLPVCELVFNFYQFIGLLMCTLYYEKIKLLRATVLVYVCIQAYCCINLFVRLNFLIGFLSSL